MRRVQLLQRLYMDGLPLQGSDAFRRSARCRHGRDSRKALLHRRPTSLYSTTETSSPGR